MTTEKSRIYTSHAYNSLQEEFTFTTTSDYVMFFIKDLNGDIMDSATV